MNKYNPNKIESKWQKEWEKSGIYKDYTKSKKFYALDMFPYPSGAGLHVGHPKGYIATDIVSRYKILKGYSVLHPMGWDAFGLPAENYAIENKVHPKEAVDKNVVVFKKQLESMGFTYDWDREINTTNPEYYKWTQWIFLKMFEKGLAYESNEPVNWCSKCKTVLANEDLENGLCERCGTQIVQKKMRQWVLKMTDYADRLLYDLDTEDLDWEDSIVQQQKNWIGRSEGVEIEFKIPCDTCANKPPKNNFKCADDKTFKVYTTRVDTIFGCTYCVLVPEHELIGQLKHKIENYNEVEKYVIIAQNKTELERTDLQKEKTGVEIKGIKAVNPFNNKKIPLFVADYILGHYGTGAVMAVPAHDKRDWDFATKEALSINSVIISDIKLDVKKYHYPKYLPKIEKNENYESAEDEYLERKIKEIKEGKSGYTGDGILVNSGEYNGLTSEKTREKMTQWLEKEEIGKKKINYKMRDWVFSRQRYWGEPIPLVFCKHCAEKIKNKKLKIKNKIFSKGELLNPGWIADNNLPVKLPEVEKYKPTDTGESPLANIKDWVNTKCPKCNGLGKRETNTMPQWAGSSWYYLRYIDNKNSKDLVDKKKEKEWMPVDLYVGGAEHATRHLLYARFWHKFLYDIKAVSTNEPFKKLVHVGLINAEDGRKMSKRWNNVVNPDDIIKEFGADSMRLYEMFMGPFTQNIAWSTEGVSGVKRFLDRVWKVVLKVSEDMKENKLEDIKRKSKLIHKTIKKVTEDIENFRFNTAISQMMIYFNERDFASKINKKGELEDNRIDLEAIEKVLILLSPFAPHIAEELWEKLGHKESIFKQKWPEYDKNLIKDEEIELVIQVNGKLRDKIKVDADISEDEAQKVALNSEKVKNFVKDKEPKKIIFVKGRLINIVV